MDRNAFFARKPKSHAVTLDDGSTVQIKKLSQADVEKIQRDYQSDAKRVEALRFIVSRTLLDDEGALLCSDGDLAALAGVDFDDVNKLATAALEFSGMKGVTQDDAKNV